MKLEVSNFQTLAITKLHLKTPFFSLPLVERAGVGVAQTLESNEKFLAITKIKATPTLTLPTRGRGLSSKSGQIQRVISNDGLGESGRCCAACPQGFDLGGVVAFEDGVAGDEDVGAGSYGGFGCIHGDAAVDFDVDVAAICEGFGLVDFFQHCGDEALAAEAWVDGHDQDEVQAVDDVFQH